jgi:hypothetical protein
MLYEEESAGKERPEESTRDNPETRGVVRMVGGKCTDFVFLKKAKRQTDNPKDYRQSKSKTTRFLVVCAQDPISPL